jgi:hypothetical protein
MSPDHGGASITSGDWEPIPADGRQLGKTLQMATLYLRRWPTVGMTPQMAGWCPHLRR